ncbi:probable 6-phosphogluconolactonase 1 [Prosopis cineraria]|uniref:probable 6-phosphogluconolactonase 1 n=1 Tax=Prosopis cineraria TaxID=364024 RepID=UPI00240FA63E|nr:probable 6-phosphogluconolactonase 1 [Prosopis cineraria]
MANSKLPEAPCSKIVDWSKWYVFWADQLLVGKNHADRNYKLAKDCLLSSFPPSKLSSNVPIIPSHVHSINDSVSAEKAADEYEFLIRQSVKNRTVKVCDTGDCPSFDFILLGLGVDGHVASLFPNQSAMNEREERVTFTTEFPKSPHERITFTLPVINSASNVAVVATGDSKADAVHLAADNVGPEFPIVPARMIRPVNGKLVWLLDEPAASKLKPSLMSY